MENSGVRIDIISRGRRCQYMFSRSSNWTVCKNSYLAKFTVAVNIKSGSVEYIEFKEFIVKFKKNSKFDLIPK